MRSAKSTSGTGGMPRKLDKDSATERLQLVAPASWIARINAWRRTQPDLPNISESIRRLTDIGIETELKRLERKAK